MSGWKFCDDVAPHEYHEWAEDYSMGPVFGFGTAWHHCAGVKEEPMLRKSLDVIKATEQTLMGLRVVASLLSERARRTEDEAMNYTPEEGE